MKIQKRNIGLMLVAVTLIVTLFVVQTLGAPTGASLTYYFNSTKNTSDPDGHTGDKGYIHTIELTSEQQDDNWKAYVGNVSSTFVLDDSAGDSIYRWSIDSFTGQVYASRNDSVTWGNIANVTEFNKTTEDSYLNHDSTSPDSINRTFSRRIHKQFTVGGTTIDTNSSYSTVTYQNDADHELNESAPFQEVLLTDGPNLIFTGFVENDIIGYKSDGTTYDFQLIVPDDANNGNPAITYYFYLELSSS